MFRAICGHCRHMMRGPTVDDLVAELRVHLEEECPEDPQPGGPVLMDHGRRGPEGGVEVPPRKREADDET